MSRFESAYGHFSDDGREYVVTRPDTPKPWVNVISNGDQGLIVSQAGGGFSWRSHSNLNRITRWSQDLIRDEQGKFIYLRDEETGAFWSASYQPTGHTPDEYRCRHGFGYSTIEQRHRGIASSLTMFASPRGEGGESCEIWLLTLTNTGDTPRKLSTTSYFEWNLGAPDPHREFHKLFIIPSYEAAQQTLFASKVLWEVPTDRGHWNADWNYVAFHGASEAPSSFDCDKASFMGRHRGPHNPQAMADATLAGKADRWCDPIGALRIPVTLAPGESHTLAFTLGAGDDRAQAELLAARYRTVEAAEAALVAIKAEWAVRLGTVTIDTPDPAFDLFTNLWVKYQAISGHMWGRAAYYQQSGAYGFRDQLQTSQAWLPIAPQGMRDQLVLHARHQLEAGPVLHWWHPLTEQGLKTNMTDDLLWMPFMALAYLKETLDWGLLDETVPYHDQGDATFEAHCHQAIDVVLSRFSPRGLPLIGEGDWCDGFSSVGIDWKGESIWLGQFLYKILVEWADVLEQHHPRKDATQAAAYRVHAAKLRDALEAHGWNGDWYICATKDDGSPMGDKSNTENQIYLNCQTWAVLAGVAPPERAKQAMQNATARLEGDNGMCLFRPAYTKVDRHIGYITRYAPGLRENGGVYTHAAVWGILAQAELGDSAAAYRLHDKLNPIAASARDTERYVAEPYVLPGNIDGPDSPLYGRAGWTWYTGSAGWMLTAGLDYIAGVRAGFAGLTVTPCLPAEWPEVRVRRVFRGCSYDIMIKRAPGAGIGNTVHAVTVDGKACEAGPLPVFADGAVHKVEVLLSGSPAARPV